MHDSDLDMLQLSDSIFPTGLFATSNGLESLFLDKKVTTAKELTELNRVFIEQQVGPCDCVALSSAYGHCILSDYEKLKETDGICVSLKTIKETRDAAVRSGIQLVKCVKEFQRDGMLDRYHAGILDEDVSGVYPVSFAVCCHALGIKREKSMLMLCYGFVASSVGAALRLGMIQHLEAQGIIHRLKPPILRTVRENSGKSIGEIWQFLPQAEIGQMDHERMDSKMFIT